MLKYAYHTKGESMGKYLMIAFTVVFLMIGAKAFFDAQPEYREKRVYTLIKPHIPYTLEKKVSGLLIRNTKTDEKIEPKPSDLYHVLDGLEKDWGKTHLRLQGDLLTIVDDNNKTIQTITLQNEDERVYIHEFFTL